MEKTITNRIDRTILIKELISNANGDIEEVPILQAYASKTDTGIEFSAPTVFQEKVYNLNKETYDTEIEVFQKDFAEEYNAEVEGELQEQIDLIMGALDELAMGGED